MSSKRKMVLAVALGAILIASLSIAGISAYFTARDRAENVVGVGNSDIDIHEIIDMADEKLYKEKAEKKAKYGSYR